MSIKPYVDEIDQIKAEIARNNARNKVLRQRMNELEKNITDYLTQSGHLGFKHNGKSVILENKEMRRPKKKKDKEEDTIEYLKKLGLSQPEEIYKKIQDIQKRSPVEETKLVFRKNKKLN